MLDDIMQCCQGHARPQSYKSGKVCADAAAQSISRRRGRLAHDKDDEIVLYMYVLIMLAERSNCNANWHHPDENKILNRTKLSLTASPLCASLESSYQVWTSSELRIRVVDHPIRLSFTA